MKKTKETKQTKGFISKAKKLRSVVMMVLLCVLMMSAATYAWFTLSNTAKVANLTMKVGEATGLQIAKDTGTQPGTYGSVLTFDDGQTPIYKITGKLLPATTTDGRVFSKPTYNDNGEVTRVVATTDSEKLTNATSNAEDEGYYYETTFYLKALGENGMTIQLKKGESMPTVNPIADTTNGATGTYVLEKNGSTSDKGYYGVQSIRISLSVGEGESVQTLIYEPNNDSHGSGGTLASLSSGTSIAGPTSTSIQSGNGRFTSQSQTISLVGNQDTKVTMRIWIEGTDTDCVNEISLHDIIAQLQFEEATTTNNTP